MVPGGRRLDGDHLGHMHIKSAKKSQTEAQRHYHHLDIIINHPKDW